MIFSIHILYESYICMNVEIKKIFLVILKMYDSIHTYVWFIHNMYDFVHTYVWQKSYISMIHTTDVKCAQFKTSPLVANQLFIIFILKNIKNGE